MMVISQEQLKKASILVVGDLMLDRYWFGDVNRISPEAPVPVVLVESRDERLGGAANVARNAAALGANVAIMGVLGNDEPGDQVLKLLHQAGVQTHVVRDDQSPTTIKLRVLGRQQQLLRIDFEKTPSRDVLLENLDQFSSLLPQFNVVLFSDYGKGGLAHVAQMIAMATNAGKVVLVDPKGDDYQKYAGAHIITPNRAELRQVVGPWVDESDLSQRANALREKLKLNYVLLTRSEEGMTLYGDLGEQHFVAQAREVFDVSGAGDTVIATLAVGLAGGASIEQSVYLANRAGGVVVGKLGTAVISPEELFE
jgi:D-glycero-beta-D-manno-heptose-7-phosphate kinase